MPSKEYPFANTVKSEDNSITIGSSSGQAADALDLGIKFDVNSTAGDIFSFTSGGSANPGNHTLTVNDGKIGIIIANGGKLTCLPYPESPSVLVMKGGSPGWEPAPDEPDGLDYILGLKGGSVEWYQLSDCENACETAEEK